MQGALHGAVGTLARNANVFGWQKLPVTPRCRACHARVLEGVAKSQFLLKAVVFKSGERTQMRFQDSQPPRTLWRGTTSEHNVSPRYLLSGQASKFGGLRS